MTKDLGPQERLFDSFEKPTYEAWRAAATETLNGAPFEKKLQTVTIEGITLKPIYNSTDVKTIREELPGQGSLLRGATAQGYMPEGWAVAQTIEATSPAQWNKKLLEALGRGQNALNLSAKNLAMLQSVEDLKEAFAGVIWEVLPSYWNVGSQPKALVEKLLAYLKAQKLQGKKLKGSLDAGVLGELLQKGSVAHIGGVEKAYDELGATFKLVKNNLPQMAVVAADTMVHAEAGANAVQQLAYALAISAQDLRELGRRGVSEKDALAKTRWSFSIGQHFFTEVAKFRAARLLWSEFVCAYGVEPKKCPARLAARTAEFNKTIFGEHVNILRTSMESFAAVIGGVESLDVVPFDALSGTPSAMSERLARNTQTIIREECGVDRLIDPAGGSYYIEALTEELAQQAWKLFQEIEKSGGYLAALKAGTIQAQVQTVAAERAKRLSQRRDVLVGTNMYAVVNAATEETTKAAVAAVISESAANEIKPLLALRLAMPYEALRSQSRSLKPKVFLATMGPLKQHKVRADFIQAFCEAGGIEVIYPAGFPTGAEVAKAVEATGAKVVVICSTDDTYPTLVPEVTAAVKAALPSVKVYLAGQPAPENEAAYKAAGMDDAISIRSNHLDTLKKITALYS